MADLYSNTELGQLIDLSYKPASFLQNYFLPSTITSDKSSISFDKIRGNRRLAPFVSPCVEGRPMRRNGASVETFSPAYIKPKMAFTPCDTTQRMPGEPLTANYSLAQRRDMQIRDDINLMMGTIENRIEWMTAQMLTFGYVDVVGDDYPLTRVDFQRDPALQTVLAGANLWSAGTATPLQNLQTWANLVAAKQGGSVTDIVMGSNVFMNLSKNPEFKDLYKNVQPIGGALPGLLPSVQDNEDKVYHGQLGQFKLWTNNAVYDDENGVSQSFIGANDVILVARQALSGFRAFGAIMDVDALYATPYFAKQWVNPDPSVLFTMIQSAPLPVARNINSTFRATVL